MRSTILQTWGNGGKRAGRIILTAVAAISMAGCHQSAHQHETDATDIHAETDGQLHSGTDKQLHSGTDGQLHAGEIHFTPEQAEAAHLETDTVRTSPFSYVLRVGGQIRAQQGDEQAIVATSDGIISLSNSSLTEGTAVRRGEVIATVSARNLRDGDPVQKARVAYETAEREFSRARRLVADHIISDKEFDRARLEYETAKAAYEGQAASLTSQGVTVTSPIPGYIKSLLVAQGEYVSVGQSIATVTQNRRLQLRADVPQRHFPHLRDLRSAHFRTAYDDRVYRLDDLHGRLLSYGRSATRDASYIPVTFEFDNVGDLLPGAFAQVYLLSAPRPDVISIPLTAITEEQGRHYVYLHLGEDIYRKQEVRTGMDDGIRVEVLSGLTPGDRVVTRGAYQVRLASVSTAIPGHSHSH